MKKAEIEGGATLWARQIIDSEIFINKPDKWFKIWFYLVNKVSHKDTKKYKRGETFLHYDWICDNTNATKDQVKKCIGWLKESGMVSTRRSTRGVWLEITKYSYFQRLDNYYYNIKAPDEALEKHQRSTREAPRYYKNDKNDKNEKKEITPKLSKQIVNTLLKEMNLIRPDGDYKLDNLFPAKTLAKRITEWLNNANNEKREYPDKEILNNFSGMLNKMDDFHQKNATNIKYIVKNFNKIINQINGIK